MSKEEKAKKQPNLKGRLIWLYIGSFVVSVAPLLVVLIINWGDYTETPSDTVKLCIGGMLALVFVFLKVVGKLHFPNRVVTFGVLFVMAFLLQSLIQDLVLLSGMALAGELADFVFFQRAIKVAKENILIGKSSDATTEKVEEVLKKYIGNGRV